MKPESVEKSAPDDSTTAQTQPELRTKRLLLRPFQLTDAERLELLINDREIAANTRSIEFPYPPGQGKVWIEKHRDWWVQGQSAVFAICEIESGELTGAIGLEIDENNQNAELGYWLGREYWNQGICTEAARSIVEFGLKQLALHKIHAHHLTRNPASGRVLEKIGMRREGHFRGHVRKWGVFEDIVFYGILACDLK